MFSYIYRHRACVVALALMVSAIVMTDALAQSPMLADNATPAVRAETLFLQATRQSPGLHASLRMQNALQQLFAAYEAGDFAQARQLAERLIDAEQANSYDRAVAHQVAAQAAWKSNDRPMAQYHLQRVLDIDALSNDDHFPVLLLLAQLQVQDGQYEAGLANLERYAAESGSFTPEEQIIKGQALYRMGRAAEASEVIHAAITAVDEPKTSWQQLLMAAYIDANELEKALTVAAELARLHPDDKLIHTTAASLYAQTGDTAQAAQLLDSLRARGQLTDERDYRQLYTLHANIQGHEAQVIEIINEGLENGLLQADYSVWLALAQSYYYSGQIPQAIDAWQQAAPLADNGETWLNLARILHAEKRIDEAKQAARHALSKGIANADDAQRIINLR